MYTLGNAREALANQQEETEHGHGQEACQEARSSREDRHQVRRHEVGWRQEAVTTPRCSGSRAGQDRPSICFWTTSSILREL